MILLLKDGADDQQTAALIDKLQDFGFAAALLPGTRKRIMAVIGDTAKLDQDLLKAQPIVERVMRIESPYPQASRALHPEDTVVSVGNVQFGGGSFAVIAGPCSVESEAQMMETARVLKGAGVQVLRGGAFKPRTSPYSFQGLGREGLRLLVQAAKASEMLTVSEILDPRDLPLFDEIDMFQVGARNMQNYELLRELGRQPKPVLLKRNPGATLQELLMSAEYVLSGGNSQVILCERGIRSFDTATRYTLDLSAVPALHEMTHLPVIVDPSHACGASALVPAMAMAGAVAGADGLMLEVHPDPPSALSDGAQSMALIDFPVLAHAINAVRPFAWSCQTNPLSTKQ